MDGTRVVHESFLICLYRPPYFHGLNISPSHCRSLFSFLFAFEASDLSLFLLLISGVFNFFCFSFNYINYLVDLLRKKKEDERKRRKPSASQIRQSCFACLQKHLWVHWFLPKCSWVCPYKEARFFQFWWGVVIFFSFLDH